MDLEESIVLLGAKLDVWFKVNLPTFKSQDRAAQGKALLQGFDIAKEFDRLKADGLQPSRRCSVHTIPALSLKQNAQHLFPKASHSVPSWRRPCMTNSEIRKQRLKL